jgi:anhydro-N-acetylmuramic acid kinase
MSSAENYTVTGLMSGSSLDGLDLAFCRFSRRETGAWEGSILKARTASFPPALLADLRRLPTATALDLVRTDAAFIRFCAGEIQQLQASCGEYPDLIASHGHTVFHNPAAGYTLQIGNGGLLAGLTGIPVVSDFRTLDVGLGGQGAPLVPGAEKHLFSSYRACLNLGGIANLSFPREAGPRGFDVCPCNQLLDLAASWLGLPFDAEGKLAEKGSTDPDLLESLRQIPYNRKTGPKSLGNEEVREIWFPVLSGYEREPENVLATLCYYIAAETAAALPPPLPGADNRILISGGGAFHPMLIRCLSQACSGWETVIPEKTMISFKEAYCFAFLGLLRWRGENNTLAAVTGAGHDAPGGAVYQPGGS